MLGSERRIQTLLEYLEGESSEIGALPRRVFTTARCEESQGLPDVRASGEANGRILQHQGRERGDALQLVYTCMC